MRRFLLASVAAAGLTLATLPAMAQEQVQPPVPTTPPITTPQPNPDVTPQQQPGTTAPSPDAAQATQAPPSEPAQTAQDMPETTTEPADARAAPAAPPATATAQAPAPADGAVATPASASEVCAPRTTSVHFGARGSALSRENGNAIEHATDAASVCNIQQVAIVDSAQGGTHTRRASAIRAALVRQGVPEDRITVEEASADAEATSTGRVDVRMTFAGVANANTVVADATPATGANAAATPTMRTAPAPSAAPSPAPEAAPSPEAMPSPTPEATPSPTPGAPTPAPGAEEQEPGTSPDT